MEFVKKIQEIKAIREVKKCAFEKGERHGLNPKDVVSILLSPVDSGSQTIAALVGLNFQENISALNEEIETQLQNLENGDISKLEELLYTQTTVLNVAFNQFLKKADSVASNHTLLAQRPELLDCFAALALKCQDQSRKTVATLSEIRNPKKPTQFIRNYVDKQLNQLRLDSDEPQAQLEGGKDAPVDIRSQGAPAAADTAMEALGTQQRTQEHSRKRKGRPKRIEARN